MHDIKDLRKNLEKYKKKFKDRNLNFEVDVFEKLDAENRKLIIKKEKLEQEKKILSKSKDRSNFEKSKKMSEEISKLQEENLIEQKKLNDLMHSLPNIALDGVPPRSKIEQQRLTVCPICRSAISKPFKPKKLGGRTNWKRISRKYLSNRSRSE